MAPTTIPNPAKTGGQKVSLACDFCRARKRKCDGVRPICGHCRLTKNTCTFNVHADKRKPPSKTYVSALEARVRTLESLLQASSLEIPPSEFEIRPTAENEPELTIRPNARDPRPVKPLDPRAQLERLPEETGATPAALADIGRLRLDVEKTDADDGTGEAQNFTYFGATSSRFLSNIADIHAGDPTDALPLDKGYEKCFPDSNDQVVFETYWEWQRIHFPIVEPTAFYGDYNAGKRNSEFVSPMLLDIIYAVGENFGPQRSIERSRAYSDRAEASIMAEIGTPKIATIQALLILSMFKMGNGKIPVAWIMNGMSVALSTRLGLHIDSSGLVKSKIMSQSTHEARRDAFWAVFVVDRLHSTIMGVHPLHSRRSISTHRPAAPTRSPFLPSNVELAGVAPILPPSPKTQETPAACWHALRDLIDVVDFMLADIYSFDAPRRTVAEDYDLVTKNMLTIQAYTDDLPSPLRITAALRGNEPCLAFLHVYVNLFILLLNRPFVGPRPPVPASATESEAAVALALERRCRSLAFDHCRKSALRIMELIRHLPRASPCFTTPYFIFSASTVLLLSPNDAQAIRSVQVGLKCLDELEADHYWVDAVVDARSRIYALAQRWGATQLFEGALSPSTNSGGTPPSEAGGPSGSLPSGPGSSPHNSPGSTFSPRQTYGNVWGNTVSTGVDSSLFDSQNMATLDAMYLDSLPEATDMIPWAGAVEPSWGTMGTHQSPEYTLPGWEFALNSDRYTPYQHPYESSHSLDAYMAALGFAGVAR